MIAVPRHDAYDGTEGLPKAIIVGQAPSAKQFAKTRSATIVVEDEFGEQKHLRLQLLRGPIAFKQGSIELKGGVPYWVLEPSDLDGPPLDIGFAWGLYDGAGSVLCLMA